MRRLAEKEDRAREQEPCRDTAPCMVRVRLWPDEYDRIVGAARKAGLPVKEWALRVIVGAAR